MLIVNTFVVEKAPLETFGKPFLVPDSNPTSHCSVVRRLWVMIAGSLGENFSRVSFSPLVWGVVVPSWILAFQRITGVSCIGGYISKDLLLVFSGNLKVECVR